MGLVQLAPPVMIFADIWNLTRCPELFGGERATEQVHHTTPHILSFPFSGVVEEVQSVIGSDNLLAFNAFYRLPVIYSNSRHVESQWQLEDSIAMHLRKEVPSQVNFFTKSARDIDSLIVGTLWSKTMAHLRQEAVKQKKLPSPLEVVLVSGDGVFAKSLEQYQEGFKSLLDLRIHVFSWKEQLSHRFEHALRFGKVHSVNALPPYLRHPLELAPKQSEVQTVEQEMEGASM